MPQTARKTSLTVLAEELFSVSLMGWQARQQSKSRTRWDLSESEYLALDLLVREGTLTVGQIQRHVGVLPAQMSRIVRALESRFDSPLIECSINPDDKRKINVSLTDAGISAHREFRESRLSHTIEVLDKLNDEDLADFRRVIRLIREAMEKG